VRRVLALLFTPLVVLASAHELYRRNQEDLHHTLSVLWPFWAAGLVAVVAFALVQRHDRWPAARAALWAYYAAGFAFTAWGFLRGLPLADRLALWALDTSAGATLFAATCVALTVALGRGRNPRSVEPALAVLALVLAAREAQGLASLDRRPPPSVADIPGAFGPGGDTRRPNVYHLILDAFQDELFEPEVEGLLDGFAHVRLASPMRHTMSVLPWILVGRWGGEPRTRLNRALTGEDSLFSDFRGAGYRSVGFVPSFLYRANPPALDLTVFLDDSVFLDGRDTARVKAMHSTLFRQLWAYSVLPAPLARPLARTNRLGLDPGTLRSVEVLRLSALAQPVVSRLGLERFLEAEPRLPARGRYTFVHLLLPHSPHVLRRDCSQGDGPTDLRQQTECTLRLVGRFLEVLRGLGRLEDSVVVIHGDHGSWYVLREGRLVADPSADLRTLLLAKPAGAHGPMRALPGLASVIDIAPTLLALAGIPPSRALDGRVLEGVLP
jgi:hypothetical protein